MRFLVVSPPVRDLLLCAKHLFFAAKAQLSWQRLKDEQGKRVRRIGVLMRGPSDGVLAAVHLDHSAGG